MQIIKWKGFKYCSILVLGLSYIYHPIKWDFHIRDYVIFDLYYFGFLVNLKGERKMILFDISEVTSETEALQVILELEDEAIEATEALRGKRNKIVRCESHIKQIMKKCAIRGWKAAFKNATAIADKLQEAKQATMGLAGLWSS